MGYHRLWSHRSFSASKALKITLAIMGTLGFQGSIRWWVLRHRLHHRYTDDLVHDPYCARKGFWFSHMGWIFARPAYSRMKLIDASDLSADEVVRFQHKYFVPLAFTTCFIAPVFIGALWDDATASFLYAGICTRIVVWHSTFCINSFAHWIGEQEFSVETTARGTLLLAFLTQGEGHHNFHHAFPRDYRNGIRTLDWDPTKWLIAMSARVGLASNLHTHSKAEIDAARVHTLRARADLLEATAGLPARDMTKLPIISRNAQPTEVSAVVGHDFWIILDEFVVDVRSFLTEDRHPGGTKVFKVWLQSMTDAGAAFYGVLNNHSGNARRMVESMRVAKMEAL
ncbi:hypothetical protein HDU84_006781 [Entophlyctis sp. JEL0112]|nr:hypothetical protein HDU84_006781 [Entophlyctis sp. JEL0112]